MIEHFADYKAQLVRLSEEHTIAFKEEMQEAFEHGFKSHYHENVDADSDLYCKSRSIFGINTAIKKAPASDSTPMSLSQRLTSRRCCVPAWLRPQPSTDSLGIS
jgi:hypothetical protein